MLNRGCGHRKAKRPSDPTPAGRKFKLEGSYLHIYVPLWCLGEVDELWLIPLAHTTKHLLPQVHHGCILRVPLNLTTTYLSISTTTLSTQKKHLKNTYPIVRNYNHLGIAAEQLNDDTSSKIIRGLQSSDSSGTHIDPEDKRTILLKKHMHQFFPGTRHLRSNDKRQ